MKALITGITGQDGSYLSELLLKKGYEVCGVVRRGSTINTTRINHIIDKLDLYYGDLSDANSITTILTQTKPDEIYNIGSMSHVKVSFDIPEYTGQITGIGPVRILEAIKSLNMMNVKFYQASSSEMYGISCPPQNENTRFQPQSPYGCAKLYAYWMTKAYRKGYNMFACNGILFNHESPRRGETFVTKKIVRKAVRIKLGLEDKIYLGNLDAKRDWGHAKDYMEAIYLIMHHSIPDDFVVATEEYYSVKEFADNVFKKLNLDIDNHIISSDKYKRPNEVPELRGDASKIRDTLGWKPKINFNDLIDEMITDVKMEEEHKYEIRPHT